MTSNGTPVGRNRLGLPLWALVALASLAAPRIVLHDLGAATSGPLVGLLAIGPPVVWIVATLRARSPRPLLTLLVIGLIYGCFLAVGHHLIWDEAFDGTVPELGGNLEDRLSPTAEEAFFRTAMTISSMFTGAAVGLVCGLVATLIQGLGRRGRG